jgi:hypothetical protein
MRKKTMALLLQKTLQLKVLLVSATAARGEAAQLTRPQVLPRFLLAKKVPVNIIMQGLVSQLEIVADKKVSALKK